MTTRPARSVTVALIASLLAAVAGCGETSPAAPTSRPAASACVAPGTPGAVWKRLPSARAAALATPGEGGVLLVAAAVGDAAVSFGGEPLRGANLVAAFDENGGHRFSRSVGPAGAVLRIAAGANGTGGTVVAGFVPGAPSADGASPASPGEALVARLDGAGDVLWTRRLADPGGTLSAAHVALDADGSVVVVADYLPRPTSFPNPPFQQGFLIARLSPQGDELWRRRFGGDFENLLARGLAMDGQGASTVALRRDRAIDHPSDLGTGPLPADTAHELMLVKFARDGETVWAQAAREEESQNIEAVVPAADGGLFVAGNIGRSRLGDVYRLDFYVARFAPAGQRLWSRSFAPAAQQTDASLALDPCGGVVAVTNASEGARSALLLVRLDDAGETREQRLLPAGDVRRAFGLAAAAGGILVLGATGEQLEQTMVTRLGL